MDIHGINLTVCDTTWYIMSTENCVEIISC